MSTITLKRWHRKITRITKVRNRHRRCCFHWTRSTLTSSTVYRMHAPIPSCHAVSTPSRRGRPEYNTRTTSRHVTQHDFPLSLPSRTQISPPRIISVLFPRITRDEPVDASSACHIQVASTQHMLLLWILDSKIYVSLPLLLFFVYIDVYMKYIIIILFTWFIFLWTVTAF